MRFKAVIRYLYLLAALFYFGMMFSCEYANVEPVIIPHFGTTVITSSSNDIMPVFSSYCTVCHPGSHSLDLSQQCAYNQLWTDGPSAPYMDTANRIINQRNVAYDTNDFT